MPAASAAGALQHSAVASEAWGAAVQCATAAVQFPNSILVLALLVA
jgi:hypothetical protein